MTKKQKKKNKTQDKEQIMFEENIYRKQIMVSHGILGKDVKEKYDTGEEK